MNPLGEILSRRRSRADELGYGPAFPDVDDREAASAYLEELAENAGRRWAEQQGVEQLRRSMLGKADEQ